MAIKCPACQAENPGTVKFCGDCGTPLSSFKGHVPMATETLPPPFQGPPLGGVFAGRYEIIEELGRGGMGIVYKARDTKLDRTVALKFLPPEWTSEPQAKERFIREARAAAALDHPHICAVHEIDEADGRMFISMAFIEGETLQQKIERCVLKPGEAVDIGIQVAAGLKEAHLKGIVHRDIKSSNIMVSAQGQAKILDFGLAKVRGGVLVTREGATMGTAAYMSPEQARGEAVDHRTDLWSLGVVLYQGLTGQMPFPGEHDQVILHSILRREPKPLRKLRAGLPIALERIVGRALEKNKKERYQSADHLLSDLLGIKKTLEAGSFEEGLSWFRILFKRRVPQILGLYVLASLGILQLVKWLVDRFVLSSHLPDFALAALLSFVPAVLLLAYFHGEPGRRKWVKSEKIGITANLAFSAALLFFSFYGKSLGAATTTVTLKNEDGQTVERVIPKSEFRKSFAVFFFENKTKDPSQDWLQYAFPRLLELDLVQDLFINASVAYNFFDQIKAAGFQEGVPLPLTLMNKIAGDAHLKYFVNGSFSKTGEDLVLETSIYETRRTTEVAKSEFRGRDIFALVDQMSLKIRRDLKIPEQHVKEVKDLPVSEIATLSAPAFKSYMDGLNAMVFERNWDKALKSFEQAAMEDPTFVFPAYEIQLLAAVMNLREKREQAFESLMRNLYRLPDRQQYLIKSAYYAFKQDREKQIAVLKMMVELSPEDIAGHGALANIYLTADRPDAALEELKRILEIDPGQKDVLLAIGSAYQQQGKSDEALKYYEKYAAQFPGDMKSFALAGELYRTLGDFERAKSSLKKALLIEPENVSILLMTANVESALGNFEESEKICREALKFAKTPQDRMRVYESLSTVFDMQGRYRESLESVLILFDESGKSRPAFLALVSKIGFLSKFIKAGRSDEAFKIVEEIRSQAAPPFDQLVPLASLCIFIGLEDAEQATAALKVVDSTPLVPEFENNRPTIVFYRARIHELRGEYEQAIATYVKFSEARPTEAIPGIGRSYRKLREFKRAEDYLKKCLKADPFDPDLHNELSQVYIDTKEMKKAREHLNIALNVWKNADPGIPKVEEARKRLAELR